MMNVKVQDGTRMQLKVGIEGQKARRGEAKYCRLEKKAVVASSQGGSAGWRLRS